MELTIKQKIHIALMYKIVKEISNIPLILKGGTGLLLGYGLNRFSEDLDFDSAKKFNLESKLKNIKLSNYKILDINHKKDNSTTSDKYFIVYEYNKDNDNLTENLKIDISYRAIYNDIKYNIINGIKIQDLKSIFTTKIGIGLDGENVNKIRYKFRDLFDINFIVNNYPNIITNDNLIRIYNCINNPEKIISDFNLDFKKDKHFNIYPTLLEDTCLELCYAVENLYNQRIKMANPCDDYSIFELSEIDKNDIDKIKKVLSKNGMEIKYILDNNSYLDKNLIIEFTKIAVKQNPFVFDIIDEAFKTNDLMKLKNENLNHYLNPPLLKNSEVENIKQLVDKGFQISYK